MTPLILGRTFGVEVFARNDRSLPCEVVGAKLICLRKTIILRVGCGGSCSGGQFACSTGTLFHYWYSDMCVRLAHYVFMDCIMSDVPWKSDGNLQNLWRKWNMLCLRRRWRERVRMVWRLPRHRQMPYLRRFQVARVHNV